LRHFGKITERSGPGIIIAAIPSLHVVCSTATIDRLA
jgi:hypothetical protein